MKALSIRGLAKTYANGVQALKGIDLDVEEGDFFALLGPNGAGKTTAIGIVTSLVTKSAGGVEVFGHDIDQSLERAKSCIGLVPQELNFNMFEKVFTIVVNQAGFYGIPRRVAVGRAERCLRQLQLWDKRDQIARSLSGGMKRRLMIARALMHEPRLLILDEPTAGVDIEIRRSMWVFLRDINASGTTIILTTHYLEEAESLCRNVAIIDRGRIIENDSMSNVIRKLSQETFVLNLRGSLDALPDLAGYRAQLVDGHTLEVEVSREQGLNDIFARLSAQLGIKVAAFQHVLEGYKVADALAEVGAGASTFSDWWGYKYEVVDAIPYNAALMTERGVVVSINSDSAEEHRHLNQEAAKTIKYGGLTEEQALKLVTINPAIQLGVDKRVGSIEVGKDADLVLYNAHPLSTFAVPQQVLIDGVVYFDRQKDLQQREARARQKQALKDKEKAGSAPARPTPPDTTPKAETTPGREEDR